MVKASKIIDILLQNLSSRHREFLEERFGLRGGSKKTLQELGDKHKITRERVRQIEAEGLRLASQRISTAKTEELFLSAEKLLKEMGGAMRDVDFLSRIKASWRDNLLTLNQLRFLFELSKNIKYRPEDENFFSFWHVKDIGEKNLQAVISAASKFFADKKEDLVFGGKMKDYLRQFAKQQKISEEAVLNYLALSKKFGKNPYADFGLSHWEEINPKTARSKAYLVLKKHGKPLHFRDIAHSINKMKFGEKPVYAQTIHNELIKDPRFVLVGRGVYGLKEHGYVPGTAREIIKKVLKESGPLSSGEIVQLVAQQRFLKENTVLLNLQNRKHFKKLSDGKYHVA